MTANLVTFSDQRMVRSADLCVSSAERFGVDEAWHIGRDYLYQKGFYKQNKVLLDQPRGLGYWSWKPYVIELAFSFGLRDGDILIYSDAGVEFVNNVSHIIERMDQDIFLFGNNWEHAHWCKRDVVGAIFPPVYLGAMETENGPVGAVYAGKPWEAFGKQCQASVIFFRVSDYSRKFVKEWLDWCLFEGGRLIDDSPSRTPNHPEFREHRHDQAILTTLAYREGIKLHWWPASYNDGAFTYEKIAEHAGDDYPVMFNHHRKRNHEWENAA